MWSTAPRSEPEGRTARSADAASVDAAWAWTPYEPDARRPWDLRGAGHLFRRAGFGATWNELQQALADGPQRAVDRLLRPTDDAAAFNRRLDEDETAAIDPDTASTDALGQWWLRRMIRTPYPLLEKMTLFWHDHFGTSSARVQFARFMQDYVRLLRTHALGRFPPLLEAVSRDPATVLSLDVGLNSRARPSENLARAILDVFGMGPGAYSEKDVREAARAFSGWSVLKRRLRYLDHEHDAGPKTVLGRSGNWDGGDVVRLVLQEPATSRRLVGKLYCWFVSESEEPSDALLTPLVESFAKDQDVGKLVATILRSNLFFSPTAYRQRIKSPVEFAVGLVRPLEALIPTVPLGRDLAALGQDICQPPTIHGWEGGRAWITTATLLGRSNLAASMLSGAEPYGDKLNPRAVAKRQGHASPEAAGRFLVDLFLQGDLDANRREALLKPPSGLRSEDAQAAWLRQLTRAIVTLPEFHLA